jgi:hypothetical protein
MLTCTRSPTLSRMRPAARSWMPSSSSWAPEVRRSVATRTLRGAAEHHRGTGTQQAPPRQAATTAVATNLPPRIIMVLVPLVHPAIVCPRHRTCSARPASVPPACARDGHAARRHGRRCRAAAAPWAAAVTGQADHHHLAFMRGLDRVAAGWRNCHRQKSPAARRRSPPSARTWRENTELKAWFVGDRGQCGAVGGQCQRRQLGAVALEAADKTGREMLRQRGGAAVAAGQHLAATGDTHHEACTAAAIGLLNTWADWYFRSALSMKCCSMRCSSMGGMITVASATGCNGAQAGLSAGIESRRSHCSCRRRSPPRQTGTAVARPAASGSGARPARCAGA